MKNSSRIGLSLSGGGYRAAAFHVGTLKKLNTLMILEHIDVISTISGGSIAGAYYLLHKDNFNEFENRMISCLQKSVIKRIVFSWASLFFITGISVFIFLIFYLFHYNKGVIAVLGTIVLLIGIFYFQFLFLPFTFLKVKAYKKIFFGNKKLEDLPDKPEIAINAANLETGTLWTYSKRKVSDSSYEFPKDGGDKITFKAKNFPLALAVASSTCVPVPFAPVKINKKYFSNPDDIKRANPSLSDGGLYDNQGIHKITQTNSSYFCDIIICSDGSQPFSIGFKGFNSFQVLYRATDIMMRKVKNLQFVCDVYSLKKEIAYFSLDWGYQQCLELFIQGMIDGKISKTIIDAHNFEFDPQSSDNKKQLLQQIKNKIDYDKIVLGALTTAQIHEISKVSTNLSALKLDVIQKLILHAETLTEILVKLFCPSLISKEDGLS